MNMPRIKLKTEFFEEDGQIIGIAPEINVSSFGSDLADAKRSLQEAVELWLEGCIEMGTLEQVLEEEGFTQSQDGSWVHRLSVAEESMTLSMPQMAMA